MNPFPNKTLQPGWIHSLCTDNSVCCASAVGGSLSVMMKWKSSRAVSTCTQTVIGDCHQRTPHYILSFQLYRDRPQSLIMFAAVKQTPAAQWQNGTS